MIPLALGLDYGTESARGVLVDLETGREVAAAVERYPHGVLERALPSGRPLPPLYALHHPADYLTVTRKLIEHMGAEARRWGQVVGIGLDTTASSPLPTNAGGTPLALQEAFADEPHAYVKLWKHHAAEPYSQAINRAKPAFLTMYGGKTSAEWSLAKAWEVLEQAPAVWQAAARWIEVGDWLVWQLTGQEVRSACQAGYKAHWQPGGYPDRQALAALHPELFSWLDKLNPPQPVGQKAGGLSSQWATEGLAAGTPVAVAVIDAHAAVPGVGVEAPGTMVAILGTSSCHLALSPTARPTPGVAGIVQNGILPGFYGYECGQPATGDMLAWWVRTLSWVGGSSEAALFERLNQSLAERPAPSGLLALDWWNGCRTPRMDASLKGVLHGLRLDTDPVQIYQALVEASALGTRLVRETLEQAVGPLERVVVTGGLSQSDPILQTYANVLGTPLEVSPTPQASARGAALYGALAAGFPLPPALAPRRFTPDERSEAYQEVYLRYLELAEFFGSASQNPKEVSQA
ncbi:ribulokinase [Meiothermus sp. CFH 77666]|uniref:ribulokinase n=1 Tax=Meiothermus sp. CFH 77666 TaxID=2817942 RepID=UPI001AA07361|nr:ribulokinase [Meiothermus sp. CFH 77666]MBO1436626.1 ribulokinase [Meiothermus sp. CFH 77666]